MENPNRVNSLGEFGFKQVDKKQISTVKRK